MIKGFVLGFLVALASVIYYRHILDPSSSKAAETGYVQNEPTFHVSDIPGKGKGVLASRDIKVCFLQDTYDVLRSNRVIYSKESSSFKSILSLLFLYTVGSFR